MDNSLDARLKKADEDIEKANNAYQAAIDASDRDRELRAYQTYQTLLSQKSQLLQLELQMTAEAGTKLHPRVEQLCRDVDQIRSDLAPISKASAECMSATLAASVAPEQRLLVLREALGCQVLTAAGDDVDELTEVDDDIDPYIAALLRRPCESAGFPWLDDEASPSEPQQRDQYLPHMKHKLKEAFQRRFRTNPPRNMRWVGATSNSHKITPEHSPFPISSRNDEVLVARMGGVTVSFIGLEVKKPSRMDWQAIRQAEVEFYVWDRLSAFPFCQLVTDFNRGGVAIFCEGQDANGVRVVRKLVLGSMKAVYDFMAGMINDIPEHNKEVKADAQGVVFPTELPTPKRQKLHQISTAGGMPGVGNLGPSSSSGGPAGGAAGAPSGATHPIAGTSGANAGGSNAGTDAITTGGASSDVRKRGSGYVRCGLYDTTQSLCTAPDKVLQLLQDIQDSDVACLRDVEDM